MDALVVLCMVLLWCAAIAVAVGFFALARYVLRDRRRVLEICGDFISDSATPILRWNLRRGPSAVNRERIGESLENMSGGGGCGEMREALRENGRRTSRTAARILGNMQAGIRTTAHT